MASSKTTRIAAVERLIRRGRRNSRRACVWRHSESRPDRDLITGMVRGFGEMVHGASGSIPRKGGVPIGTS